MRRVLSEPPKLMKNIWKTTVAALVMGLATFAAYKGLQLLGLGMTVCCLAAIVVAVFVYALLAVFLKVLTYEDCLLLPKGEKIAKILRIR